MLPGFFVLKTLDWLNLYFLKKYGIIKIRQRRYLMQNRNERWLSLWHRLNAIGDASIPITDLLTRYSESWRAYHTIEHIDATLTELDQFCSSGGKIDDLAAVEMAIWYHDVVYDTKAKDNEEKSAELFRTIALNSGISERFIKKVSLMILATKHTWGTTLRGAQIVCDSDLSILGQSEEIFDEYEKNIRIEYEWVPEDKFVKGRMTVLKSFLERISIFQTKFFCKKYEEQARKNLTRSIERLSTRSQS